MVYQYCNKSLIVALPVILLGLVSGCGPSGERLAGIATQNALGSAASLSSPTVVPPSTDLKNPYCKLGTGIPDVPAFGTSDGPAKLPTACYFTAMSATPSTKIIIKSTPASFQSDLNAAQCGDVLELAAGQVYPGSFTLPAKSCDKKNYITIQSDHLSLLPHEGVRVSPCYANVATLLDRPAFACPAGGPQKLMPQVLANIKDQPAFVAATGANYYRLIGLEIAQAPGVHQYQLVDLNQVDHIIVDRSWIHGTATDETQSAVHAAGTYLAIIDSYLNDTKCLSSGSCIDSQAVRGGTGTNVQGPIKIVNNFLESAGESFIYGGGFATVTPTDFEIRRNHSFKPLSWRVGDAHFPFPAGVHPIIKNLGEFKNGSRILIEDNIFEQVWQGQSDQIGFAILLNGKNQSGKCPTCIVTDVTFRFNKVAHANNGMQIDSNKSDNGTFAKGTHRLSIHDNIFDDINFFKWASVGGCCVGGNTFVVENGNAIPGDATSDITINHNTAVGIGHTSASANFVSEIDGQVPGAPINNLVITNNVAPAGVVASPNSSGGSPIQDVTLALDTVNSTKWSMALNLLPLSVSSGTSGTHNYPPKNLVCGANSATCLPKDFTGVFVNYNSGDGGDYTLVPSSPYKNSGSDGKDLGADIAVVNSKTAGVQ